MLMAPVEHSMGDLDTPAPEYSQKSRHIERRWIEIIRSGDYSFSRTRTAPKTAVTSKVKAASVGAKPGD